MINPYVNKSIRYKGLESLIPAVDEHFKTDPYLWIADVYGCLADRRLRLPCMYRSLVVFQVDASGCFAA